MSSAEASEQQEAYSQIDLQQRASAVRARARRFMKTVIDTKASSAQEIAGLESYFSGMQLVEEGYDGVRDRERFFDGDAGQEGWGVKMERDAVNLYQKFISAIESAKTHGLISDRSKNEWMRRFSDKSVGFKAKEYWVDHQMPDFIRNWERVGKERKELSQAKGFDTLVRIDPKFSILKNSSIEKFLDLHYDDRKGLIADAKAALLASNKVQLDLYATAKSKLSTAVSGGYLASSKVGSWLHRIFDANAERKQIQQFLHNSGPETLADLMKNWQKVKDRFDIAKDKFKNSTEQTMPRGLHPLSDSQFLALHYDQRLHYVEELEKRMTDTPDISTELPQFVEIRHAMDTQDWTGAALLIAEAKKKDLTAEQKGRLTSMEQYVRRFNTKESSELNSALEAKRTIDSVVEQLGRSHSQMQPMIIRLLRSSDPNRAMHQLRWITYNNIWCRRHGPPYLDDNVARKGASDDNAELTKYRAEQGMDVGRHDVLSHETADASYFRKKEVSTHKATFIHANVSSGGVMNVLAEKLEHEQHPKWLYWNTLNCHEDGDPKSENWHNDLFFHLTTLRSATATMKRHGFRYDGPGRPLIGLN